MAMERPRQAEMVVRPSITLHEFPDYYFQKLADCEAVTSRPGAFQPVSPVFGYMLGLDPRATSTSFPCFACHRPCFDGGLSKKLRCTCGQIQVRLENCTVM